MKIKMNIIKTIKIILSVIIVILVGCIVGNNFSEDIEWKRIINLKQQLRTELENYYTIYSKKLVGYSSNGKVIGFRYYANDEFYNSTQTEDSSTFTGRIISSVYGNKETYIIVHYNYKSNEITKLNNKIEELRNAYRLYRINAKEYDKINKIILITIFWIFSFILSCIAVKLLHKK